MDLKSLIGIAGCSVIGPLLILAVLVTALLAMVIPQLPFAQAQAWQWMLGTPQSSEPTAPSSSDDTPIVSGGGQWCAH